MNFLKKNGMALLVTALYFYVWFKYMFFGIQPDNFTAITLIISVMAMYFGKIYDLLNK